MVKYVSDVSLWESLEVARLKKKKFSLLHLLVIFKIII